MREITFPMYVLHGNLPVRAVERDGRYFFEKYDPVSDSFIEDFDACYRVLSGLRPYEEGMDYAYDNEVVTLEEFEGKVTELKSKRLKD